MSTSSPIAKNSPAWITFERSQRAPCLRLELPDKAFLVQYGDFIKATMNEAQTHISLYFHALDAVIRGEKLQALFLEIQRFNVDYVRIGSGKEGDPVKIERIVIREAPLEEKPEPVAE
jgi:hypothetical protein